MVQTWRKALQKGQLSNCLGFPEDIEYSMYFKKTNQKITYNSPVEKKEVG